MPMKKIKKIKRGDTVIVISGREKGKIGKVLSLLHDTQQVIVEGINLRKRVVKDNQGKVTFAKTEFPIHVSNVMFLDPKEKVGTRIGFTIDEKGKKVRIAKKSKTELI